MSEYYPFLPKSTNTLSEGDFWAIQLKDGRFASGVVVELLPVSNKPPSHKVYFLAGILNWQSDLPPTKETISSVKTFRQGLVNISVVRDANGIVGHINLAENNIVADYFVSRSTYSEKQSRLMQGVTDIRAATPSDYNQYRKLEQWTDDQILYIAAGIGY